MSQTQRRMEPQVEVIISRARSWLHTSGLRARLALVHTWDFWLKQHGPAATFHPEVCRRGFCGLCGGSQLQVVSSTSPPPLKPHVSVCLSCRHLGARAPACSEVGHQ